MGSCWLCSFANGLFSMVSGLSSVQNKHLFKKRPRIKLSDLVKPLAIAQIKLESPLGALFLKASERGLCGLSFEKYSDVAFLNKTKNFSLKEHLAKGKTFLEAYFKKQKPSLLSLSFDLEGTPFQKQVWNALSKISYGQTLSYQGLAERIQKPKACRAVGSANGKNPLFIIIPCHRVIAANGSMGGYSGGLKVKEFLLRLEGVDC